MNVKEGDTITAGQPLGKLIKTAPQSHVHIHIMKNEQTVCFESMFNENDRSEMMTKLATAPNKPKQICYQ
jgi:murein DD-endopeptidase MepM/ murein hydrolase activator NlpD